MLPRSLLPETMTLVPTMLEDTSGVRFGIAVYAVFPLQQHLSEPQEHLAPAQDFWPLMARAMGKLAVVDKGFPKPRGEFLLYGACYTDKPVQASQVRAMVGPLDKTVLVFGPRRWGVSGIERFGSFSRMPLDFFHAFGGPDYDANPLGMGHKSTGSDLLPHLEDPKNQIGARSDKPLPAGFYALPSSWPQRTRYLGRFDKRWLNERWPFLPDDTVPEFCNNAPADQWLPGYFSGNEKLRLENMHPEHPALEAELPGLRARLFCRRQGLQEDKAFEEIGLHAETLWIFPDYEQGVLLFRGSFLCQDDELTDIELFYGAWERIQDAPLPADHYHDLLLQQVAAEQAEAAETEAPPEEAEEEAAQEPLEEPEATGAPSAGVPGKALAAGAVAAATQLGVPPAQTAAIPPLPEMQASLAELEKIVDDTAREADMSREERDALANDLEQQRLEQQQQDEADEAELREFMRSQGKSDEEIASMDGLEKLQMTQLWAEDNIKRVLAEHGLDSSAMESLPAGDEQSEADPDQVIAQLKQTAETYRQQGLDMSEYDKAMQQFKEVEKELQGLVMPLAVAGRQADAPETQLPEPAPHAAASEQEPGAVPAAQTVPETTHEELRAQVLRLCREGKKLSVLDLSGADLSGLDLSGCDCSQANLAGANLEDCRLRDAVFYKADLRESQISGADLSGASLHSAMMSLAYGENVTAVGAFFTQASCNALHLVKSDLADADFTKSRLDDANFEECNLANALFISTRGRQASMLHCTLTGCDCSKADFEGLRLEGSQLDNALFDKTRAPELRLQGVSGAVRFVGCNLKGSRADEKTRLDGAHFEKCDLRASCLAGASLRQTTFDRSRMEQIDCSNTDLSKARLRHCRLRNANFTKARLHETDLAESDLLEARLRKAELHRTHCYRANFFAADFYLASFSQVNLQRANLKRTLIAHGLP